MIARWLEEHANELDSLATKIAQERGREISIERVVTDMLDQALEVFLTMYEEIEEERAERREKF